MIPSGPKTLGAAPHLSAGISPSFLDSLTSSSGLTGVTQGVQAASQISDTIFSWMRAKSQAAYQAQQLQFMSRLAKIKAKDAIERGIDNATRLKEQSNLLNSEIRAKVAAQGIDPNVGSAADVQRSIDYQSSMDALQIQNNAWREAWGYRFAAASYSSGSALALAEGEAVGGQTLLEGGVEGAGYATKALRSFWETYADA